MGGGIIVAMVTSPGHKLGQLIAGLIVKVTCMIWITFLRGMARGIRWTNPSHLSNSLEGDTQNIQGIKPGR
jgi:hypothetical protein